MATTIKKQHYVWRKYLASWTNNGSLDTGKIFVYRKKTRGTQQKFEQRELMKIGFEFRTVYPGIAGGDDDNRLSAGRKRQRFCDSARLTTQCFCRQFHRGTRNLKLLYPFLYPGFPKIFPDLFNRHDVFSPYPMPAL